MNAPRRRPSPAARVAVTGVGVVSALGTGSEMRQAALGEGETAVRPVDDPAPGLPRACCASVEGYAVEELLGTRKAYLDRHTALLLGAAALALTESGLIDAADEARSRGGLMTGSAWGGLGTLALFFRDVLQKGPRFAKPILFPHAYANTASSLVAIEWALQGPHEHYACGRLSSAHALVAALDSLRAAETDWMLAGGCEGLSPALFLALEAQGELRHDPEDGGVAPGEGAALLVIERADPAPGSGSRPLAYLSGAGLSGGSLAEARERALAEAGIGEREVDVVFTCGRQTEGQGAQPARTERAEGPSAPPELSLEALEGDLLGAAFALHVATAVQTLADPRSLPGCPPEPRVALVTLATPDGAAAVVVERAENGRPGMSG